MMIGGKIIGRYQKNMATKGKFAMVAHDAVGKVINLNVRDYDVLVVLVEHIEPNNTVSMRQEDIAKFVNMQQQNVSRNLKNLEKLKLIKSFRKGQKMKSYRLFPMGVQSIYLHRLGETFADEVYKDEDGIYRLKTKVEMQDEADQEA